MSLEVIGAGFGRTGTLSLKLALERLGFVKTYHMVEVFEHPEHMDLWLAAHRGDGAVWDRLFDGYRAAVDWPVCDFWEPLLDVYPDAKVILTSRDPERWFESIMNTIYPATMAPSESDHPMMARHRTMARELIWDGTFDGRAEQKDHAIAVYEAHNRCVRTTVPPERLLDFEVAHGWEPLCAFLARSVPDEPFPRVNSTEEFVGRRRS